MKLIVYETTHHETLPAMLDLAEVHFEKTAVFLKEISYNNLCIKERPESRWPKTLFVKQTAGHPNRLFIRETFSFLKKNKYSHLHISTLDNNFLFFALQLIPLKKMTVSLSVQAVNEYSRFKFNNLRDFTESLAKHYFHKRIKHYRVFFPLMKKTFETRFPNGKAIFIPPVFFSADKNEAEALSNRFRIVLPGTVDPSRRDYDFVLLFLKEFLPQYRNAKPLELVILGSSDTDYGQQFIKELQGLESASFKLISYNEYIPQAEYEAQLSQADILWSPIRLETRGIRGSAERYGVSMATGLTGDLLLNSKPVLIPAGFHVPEHYEKAMISYSSSAELGQLIHSLDKDRLRDLGEKIKQSFSFFVKQNFDASFKQLMEIH